MNNDPNKSELSQNVSSSNSNPNSNTNPHLSITEKINELTFLNNELEYWQKKVINKNLELLNNTLEYSKKKDELRQRLERATSENSEFKVKIKELEGSILSDNQAIQENKVYLDEIKYQNPEFEKENVEIFNEVRISRKISTVISLSLSIPSTHLR